MKIAFDHQIFTIQSYGGISRYFTFLANELFKSKQKVHVFAGLHRNNYVNSIPDNIISGVKLKRYPRKTAGVFKWFNHAFSQIGMKKMNPDIIHETYYSDNQILKSSSVRIASVYDMIHELYSDQFSSNKITEIKKNTFERVDHIISISESTKRDLIDLFGIAENKISVVHLGVDVSAFQKRPNIQIKRDKPFVLYVGKRAGHKNFNGFIRAFATSRRLKNEIKIVAFGGGGFNAQEQMLIKQLGFEPGHVQQVSGNDETLSALYHGATVFVYPSLYEGFGLPPLEAMAAGCPVVSSNSSSMPEVVKDAAIYFNPNNLDEIRNALEKVIFSDDLKKQLIQKGFKNVENFTWEKCANETLKVYKDLTGKE